MSTSTNKREAVEADSHDDLMRFLNIFWERKLFVLFGLALGLLVGTLYYVKAKPVFQASARVLIQKKGPEVLPIAGNDPRGGTYFDDYVGTQQVLIRSPEVLSRLVRMEEFQALTFSKNEQKAIDQITASLTVLRGADKEKEGTTSLGMLGGGNSVLSLIFKNSHAEDCTQVVRLLLRAYNDYLDATYQNVSEESLKLIREARETQEKTITKAQNEREQFLREKPQVVMMRSKRGGGDSYSGISERFGFYQDQQAALQLRKMEILSHLQSMKAIQGKEPRNILKAIITRFDKVMPEQAKFVGPDITLDGALVQLVIKEADLASKFGKDNIELVTTRANLNVVRKLISQRDEGLSSGAGGPDDMLLFHDKLMKQELDEIAIRDENLQKLMAVEKDKAGQEIGDQIKLATMESDIEAMKAIRQGIVERLGQLNLVKESGGYAATVMSPPSLAVQVEPKLTLTFSLAAVAGIILGLGLAYLTDLTDRSFRTPVDISRSLKMPVVGHVPVLTGKAPTDQQTNLSPFLCTHFRPKSRDAEAFREIRTALYFNTRNTNCRKLQITSAASGDGKSTMASNLAISIAQSGKKVLLVDCDLRRPRVHTLFGMSNEAGFSTVLTENAEPSDVTNVDVVPGLSVIPAGPGLPNPAEILTSTRFHECANLLAEKYDFVLFDTPPLLAVTDPAVIAPRMDGVFLVVRLGKRERNMAERSAEILRTLEANVIGVVVNAIGQDGMGYGRYGRYYYGRYSYYYGSGGYRYGSKGYRYGNDGYYADEDRENGNLAPAASTAANGHKTAESGADGQDANGEQQPAQAGSIKRAFRWFLGD